MVDRLEVLAEIRVGKDKALEALKATLPRSEDSDAYEVKPTYNAQELANGRYLATAKYRLKPGVASQVQTPGRGSAPSELERRLDQYKI